MFYKVLWVGCFKPYLSNSLQNYRKFVKCANFLFTERYLVFIFLRFVIFVLQNNGHIDFKSAQGRQVASNQYSCQHGYNTSHLSFR